MANEKVGCDAVDRCSPSTGSAMDPNAAAAVGRAFAAVADPVRLRLLSLIASCSPDEVCACDLTEPAGRSQPTVSHHMKVLFDAGLVERDKRGLWVWYRATAAGRELHAWALSRAADLA